jgi:hypothetical protein
LGRDKEERTLTDGAMDTASDAGADNGLDNNCKLAAKNTVVDDEGNKCVDKICNILNNVDIEEGDADDNNFEGDGSNLGWGKEETTLTDGAKDPVSNVGANNSSVDNMDEIGIIFDFEGKKKEYA